MRTLVALHGMSAALCFAAALHVFLFARKRRLPSRGSAIGLLLTLLTLYITGWLTYPTFRTQVRAELLASEPWLANFFDVKEFLSWGALLGGLAVGIWAVRRIPFDEGSRRVTLLLTFFLMAVLLFNIVAGITLSVHETIR